MSNETCTAETCRPSAGPNTGCEMTDQFLSLADQAWTELLKDKMKAEIQKTCGEKLDGLARFLVEGNAERRSALIQGRAKCEQFKTGLAKMMVEGAAKK